MYTLHMGSSYNSTSSVKHSYWMIKSWIDQWNGLQGHKKGGNHKGTGQVNDTNIQDNWTPQDKYNGWQYKMVQYKWTLKQKQLCEQYVNMWLCVQLYAILDVVISKYK